MKVNIDLAPLIAAEFFGENQQLTEFLNVLSKNKP